MEKPILKAYYGDIFFEFINHKEPTDTILYLEGFPSSGSHKKEIEFLYRKGYNIFVPHYKGTYQSRGKFLGGNIVYELKEFLDKLKMGSVINLWDMSEVNFKIKRLILFGGSFSGAICCGLSTLTKFDKIVLFAPVLDYLRLNEKGDEQDPDHMIPFVKRAYENLFRFDFDKIVERMSKFKECSPNYYLNKLKTPVLILHDPTDKTVSIRMAKEFEKKLPNIKLIESSEGHKMDKTLEKEWTKIKKFLED